MKLAPVLLAIALSTLLVPAVRPARAQQDPELARIWADPEFKKHFLGTYGINAEIEPRLGPEQRELLEQVYPLLASDPAEAVRRLQDAVATPAEQAADSGKDKKKSRRRRSSGAAESTNPADTALFEFILGNIAFQKDDAAEAMKRYQNAVTKFPNFRRAYKNLGLTQVRAGETDQAIKSFTRMIELGGGDAVSYGLLGYAYSSKADYLAAEAAYRNALLLDPQNNEWRLGLARSVNKQEKYEEAVALLRVLIERNPERHEFWLLQANAYIGMKQPLRAAENLEVVYKMDKATPDTMNLLGDIYVNEGRPDLAQASYARAIDLDPLQPSGRALRSTEALAARGANDEAHALSLKVRETFGDRMTDDERRRLLKLDARIASARGDDEQSAEVLEQIVALDPLDGDALILLGQHHARLGEPEKAAVYLERAANIEKFEGPAKMRLGQLLVAQGKYGDALPLLRRAQEIKPQEEVARYIDQVERIVRARR